MNSRTELLEFQRSAVEKLGSIRLGALFMEMGTGKSRTAIELALRRRNRIRNVVWFCPVALKLTIQHEILKHTDCAPSDICVFDHRITDDALPAAFWYIIGIESMSASARVVLATHKLISPDTMVIVDESSYIKGHRAMRTRRITAFSEEARYRLILTGTPISQGVVDLYAQMAFLSPKILGYRSFYSFAANHLEYSDLYPGLIVESHNTEYLAAKIAPYVYQITKEECLVLPDKCYSTRIFAMSWQQRELYEDAKNEILLDLDPEEFNGIAIFRLFTALQQITCGFWNRRNRAGDMQLIEIAHHRTGILLDVVRSLPPDAKCIIWAKYQYDITGIGTALQEEYGEASVAFFHGRLNERQRNAQVALFRADARFFVATQSCGGHGLTLNEASHVIFYNNAFKYSERLQAEDRCHRIGQESKVLYIDIRCADSIDDRIHNALAAKGSAVEAFKHEVDELKDMSPEERRNRLARLVEAL